MQEVSGAGGCPGGPSRDVRGHGFLSIKVELIQSLVPLGLMHAHIRLGLDSEAGRQPGGLSGAGPARRGLRGAGRDAVARTDDRGKADRDRGKSWVINL